MGGGRRSVQHLPGQLRLRAGGHLRRGDGEALERGNVRLAAGRHGGGRAPQPRLYTRSGVQLRLSQPRVRRRFLSQVRPAGLLPRRSLHGHGRAVPRAGGRGARHGPARHHRRRVQPHQLAPPLLSGCAAARQGFAVLAVLLFPAGGRALPREGRGTGLRLFFLRAADAQDRHRLSPAARLFLRRRRALGARIRRGRLAAGRGQRGGRRLFARLPAGGEGREAGRHHHRRGVGRTPATICRAT